MASCSELPRQQRLQQFQRSITIPETYLTNSRSEEGLLAFVDRFCTLYHKYYPDRKPLLLAPLNECQKRKTICSFTRPTCLRFNELYDLSACTRFVAGYMKYEPLHDPVLYESGEDDTVERFPELVVSPATALDWQVGNCLEMSLVLVSFLLGAGYKAFVVAGYARRQVCLNDQSGRHCDYEIPVEVNSDEEEAAPADIDPEYASLMKQRPPLRHPSDPEPTRQTIAVERSPLEALNSGFAPADAKNEDHDYKQQPVWAANHVVRPAHCWVLVLPGGRKTVNEAMLVEPSTGEQIPFSAADEYYLGVEAIFNDRHYYINMHPEALVSALPVDLKDAAQWESVFPSEKAEAENENLAATMSSGVGRRAMVDLAATTGGIASGEFREADTKLTIQPTHSWVEELVINRAQFESRYPSGVKVICYADAVVYLYAEYSQPDLRVKEIVVPDSRYPELQQVHLFYQHRADKLRRRSVFPLPEDEALPSPIKPGGFTSFPPYRLLHEWYDKGRMRDAAVEGLRECIHEPRVQRTMKFYWKAREDGLLRRCELFYDAYSLRKVKEFYRGRRDRLLYRSASFEQPRTVRETNAHGMIVAAGCGGGGGLKDYPRLEPVRLSQKFARNEAVPFDKDVAKTTFFRSLASQGGGFTGEMWVFFHYPTDSIIRPYHMFAKATSSVDDYIAASVSRKPSEAPTKVVAMPGAAIPSELELHNERKWLSGAEASCLAAVRANMEAALDTLLGMEQDHNSVGAVLSSYDTLRNRSKETEAERAKKLADAIRREESRKDYLAPYIAKLEMPAGFDGDYLSVSLTVDQAKQVRDEALQELKERLIQRGVIMQGRMDKEKEDFNARQLAYQRNCEMAAVDGGKEAEEFAVYCREATWRMKVLDDRLSKHIEQASERYTQLAQRLAHDARLSALYGSQ